MAKKYSASERKAYHMGRAFEAAKQGKRVECPDKKTRQSFRNGVNVVKGKKPTQACGAPAYIVNADGVILKVLNGGDKK